MDNFTPNELKDLAAMKQRVMHNVVQKIENNNSQKSNYRWIFKLLTTILTMSAILFVINQFVNVSQHSTINSPIDYTQPLFEDKEGLFYLHGVTLGDSKSNVVELLGNNFTTEFQEDGSNADLILDYEGDARFYFYEGKLDRILLLNTNEDMFANLFNEYNGMKFTSYDQRYLYSSETSHIIKAEFTPMNTLQLSLSYADLTQLMENEGYLKLIEKTD